MDNYFKIGPAKMSDARIFTDYRTATTREEYNKHTVNIIRDDDYRLYLQQNAENILDNEWDKNKKSYYVGNKNCIHNYTTAVNPKTFYVETSKYDSTYHTNKNIYPCQQLNDYRLTHTKLCKY